MNGLNKEEALKLLSVCKPLADRLAKDYWNYSITKVDEDVLDGFARVHEAGLTNDFELRQAAKLTLNQILLLLSALRKVRSSGG
jgi:hypothetical protein